MKKTINILFLIIRTIMLNIVSLPAQALEIPQDSDIISITQSEYDLYVSQKEKNAGNTNRNLTNNYIEAELLNRQNMSEEILKDVYGYSDYQIYILKSYDGTPIEDNPQLRAVMSATLSAQISNISFTGNQVSFTIKWNWSSMPFFCGEDIATIYLSGRDANSFPLQLEVTGYSGFVDMYTSAGAKMKTNNLSISKYGYDRVYSKFQMSEMLDNAINIYAKHGEISCVAKPGAGATMADANITFDYGHSVITLSPSFSFSGPSVSFGTGVEHHNLINRTVN